MTVIAVKPTVLKDAILKVGADNYEAHVSTCQFDPNSSIVRWKGMTPAAVFTDATTADWTCTLGYAQDWATASSLSSYLLANEGKTVSADFYPVRGGDGFRADLVVTPGSIGGPVDGVAAASVTLAVKGRPVRITSAGAVIA